MSNNAEWGMMDSFHIDHGELNGLEPHECFVLGVEWQMFAHQLREFEEGKIPGFCRQIHTRNTERLENLCEEHKVAYLTRWVNDDWQTITVGEPPA